MEEPGKTESEAGQTKAETQAGTAGAQIPRPQRGAGWRVAVLAVLGLFLAAGFAGVSWYETRVRIGATQEEVARRMRDIETESRDARAYAHQVQEGQRELQAKVAQLDGRLAESQNQQVALEALYQELSRGRDEWQLAEVEQVLAIASQQLQLSGNVRAALLALQLADSRLARSDRPQFLPIRRAIARDIERLKASPLLDIVGMSVKIDALAAGVDKLPLRFEERGVQSEQAGGAAEPGVEGFWSRLGREVWGELKQLIIVRRVDDAEPELLAPSQEYFMRENLRLRLLNARVSLLMRDEAGYREHLRASEAWVRRYFDSRSKLTVGALVQFKELASAPLGADLPSISESLEAVRGYKARRERGS
jgi:uroporphyrin-3 C-methyltransferase